MIAGVLITGLVLVLGTVTSVVAEPQTRIPIGWAQIFNNDYIGDGKDRWRSGSYRLSKTYAKDNWSGTRPGVIGDLIEYRFGAEIIAPASLTRQRPQDRPYAGVLSFGVHTHFSQSGVDYSFGVDLFGTGPQTGIDDFQTAAHQVIGATKPQALDGQIGNGLYPTALVEAAREHSFGPNISARPFVELQGGIETFARIGADILIGPLMQDELLLRDTVTGQIIQGSKPDTTGGALVLGADFAYLADSQLLPQNQIEMRTTRSRVRAGYHWQGQRTGLFYGATWMGREFEDQPDGQLVGSIRLQLNF